MWSCSRLPFNLAEIPPWDLKIKFPSGPKIQPVTPPENVFDRVRAEESLLALKFHQKFWLWQSLLFFELQATVLVLFCNGKQQLGFFTEAVVQNALVTCCKALSHYNLICCHMLAQKGCNSIIHWCIGHVGSRNVGLVSSRAAQICVGLWFLRFLGTLVQLSAGSFWEGGAGKEVVTWIIFLIAFSPVVASAQPRRPQTIDWEPKWIL